MVEILEIRLAEKLNQVFETEIEKIMREVLQKPMEYTMKFYKNSNLYSDYLIIIVSTNMASNLKGSKLGQRLKSSLSDYGIISYSIWNEVLSENNN